MTALETVNTIRMMLDDGKDWFPSIGHVVREINNAQRTAVMKYHTSMNERFLRPLYKKVIGITNGGIIDSTGDCMYIRSVRFIADPTDPITESIHGEYLAYPLFINERNTAYDVTRYFVTYDVSQYFPQSAIWTFKQIQDVDGILKKQLYFKQDIPGQRIANVWYIKSPVEFICDPKLDATTHVGLEVPSEFHPEICFLASEKLNTSDVGEMERGDIAIDRAGQRLTLQGSLLQ